MIYWDSSALMEAVYEPSLMKRLIAESGLARPHALAEVFSVLTGNPETRIDATNAARVLQNLNAHLQMVELSAQEVVAAASRARRLGVRGGRINDLLHAVAAEKAKASAILTLDQNDFHGLTKLEVEAI